uniref:Neurotransmitter-gated ion-channel ligand-binding domain-containing protein n=1 Tax=Sus scrofa TaxID=9823 RepID=A0A8D1TM76_PIG
LRGILGTSWAALGAPLRVSLQGEFQRKLYKDLVKNYNPLERPVANDSQPLTVYFSLSLLQIMDVVSTGPAPSPRLGFRGAVEAPDLCNIWVSLFFGSSRLLWILSCHWHVLHTIQIVCRSGCHFKWVSLSSLYKAWDLALEQCVRIAVFLGGKSVVGRRCKKSYNR